MKQLIFVCIILLSTVVYSIDKVPSKIASPDIVLGDPVEIVVEKQFSSDVNAAFESSSDKVFITDVKKAEKNTVVTLSVVKTGDITIPPVIITADKSQFILDEHTITVASAITEKDSNVRDIKDVVTTVEEDFTLLYLAAVLLVAILLFILWKIFGNKLKRKVKPEPVYVKSAYEIAMEYYAQAEKYHQENDLENYVDTITAGIRKYLEIKMKLHFLEMTTKEVTRSLKKTSVTREIAERIVTLLKDGDRFKFAQESLQKEAFDTMKKEYKSLVDLIENTEKANAPA